MREADISSTRTYTYGHMENAVELTQHFSYPEHREWVERVCEALEGSRGINELIITLARELDDQAQVLGIVWGEALEWIDTCQVLGAAVRELPNEQIARSDWAQFVREFLRKELLNAGEGVS